MKLSVTKLGLLLALTVLLVASPLAAKTKKKAKHVVDKTASAETSKPQKGAKKHAKLEEAKAPVAVVLLIVGKVEAKLPGKGWEAVQLGSELPVGSGLRTKENSSAKLRSPDDALTVLAANTEITITALHSTVRPRTALSFVNGLLHTVWTGKHGKASFDVYNSNAVAAIKGTNAQFESAGGKISVKVFETENKGVQLSTWNGTADRVIRAGEEGGIGKDGKIFAQPLDQADLDKANREASLGLKPLVTVVVPPKEEPKPLTKEEKKDQVRELLTKDPDVKLDPKKVEDLAEKVASGQTSLALVERLSEEAHQGGNASDGVFTKLADDKGLDTGISQVFDEIREKKEEVIQQEKKDDVQPETKEKPSGGGSNNLVEQVKQEVAALQDDLSDQAAQENAQRRNDALDGNSYIDRLGYRVELSNVVLRPDAATVQKVSYSKRTDGPNIGQSIFSHKVVFNQALPMDWTGIYTSLIDGRNKQFVANDLGPATPTYWPVFEQVALSSPTQCQWCYSQTFDAPVQVGGSWHQGVLEQYSVQGLDRGQRHYDESGNLTAGSDDIQITVSRTDDHAWAFDYYNNTLGTAMFSAKMWLIDKKGGKDGVSNFGVGLIGLKGFVNPGLDRIFELQVTAPEYQGRDIDLLVPLDSLVQAF